MGDYTIAELQTLVRAPMMTGLSVAMIDMGLVSTAIEAAAMSKQIAGAAAKYPANSIIQAAFSEATLKSGEVKLDKPEVKPEEVKSGAMIEEAIADINAAIALVDGKASAPEVMEYKQFIYDCGVAVAEAAGSGLFGTGTKVSAAEAEALDRFKLVLGL
ncbi:hypothetical protein [Nodosilinea sp. E11]|uniref:hypothetical protein n=1 Tax=Nodosilinea sp. E11 TaxID=3037479 RepID=UPI0029352A68|nr:hypothetical protein [Nodosilinea sp. E11]WOD38982.1 hypothetical protein RRF56_22510 [Nodosilinea sp. E11]